MYNFPHKCSNILKSNVFFLGISFFTKPMNHHTKFPKNRPKFFKKITSLPKLPLKLSPKSFHWFRNLLSFRCCVFTNEYFSIYAESFWIFDAARFDGRFVYVLSSSAQDEKGQGAATTTAAQQEFLWPCVGELKSFFSSQAFRVDGSL